jgi:uncharacterized membrane protein YqjE
MERETDITVESGARAPAPGEEQSLGELFRQLAQDSATLMRQEVALARAEMSENVGKLGKDLAYLAIGVGILLAGMLVLTAFLVILVGDLIGNYWLGALIIGVIFAVIGAVLVARGKSNLQGGEIKPERTLDSLREDKNWAQAEVKQVKRGLTM